MRSERVACSGGPGKSGIKVVREASLKMRENLQPIPECGEEAEI